MWSERHVQATLLPTSLPPLMRLHRRIHGRAGPPAKLRGWSLAGRATACAVLIVDGVVVGALFPGTTGADVCGLGACAECCVTDSGAGVISTSALIACTSFGIGADCVGGSLATKPSAPGGRGFANLRASPPNWMSA